MCPCSWEGWAVTLALLLGMGLLQLESDPTRRAIAMVLVVAAYCAVVIMTWADPDSDERRGWRETLWNRRTLVWLVVLLVFAAAFVAANYACGGCRRMAVPGLHAGAPTALSLASAR
jgi:hypothetical protein